MPQKLITNGAELTDEQEQELTDILDAIENNSETLNEWESNFFQDNKERYEKYGAKLYLSPKQWAILRKMRDAVTG